MKRRKPPSLVNLRRMYRYESDTGLFRFRYDVGTRGRKDAVAGAKRVDGYIGIALDGKIYLAHHLAWYYAYGVWPTRIDHKDRVKSNNRVNNLRIATHSQNGINSFGWSLRKRKNKFPKGVYFDRSKSSRPLAAIRVNGKLKIIGFFNTVAEASAAYQAASKQHHGEFSPFGSEP